MKLSTKTWLAGASFLAGLGALGAAHATTPVVINTAGIYDPAVINASGVVNNGVYASAVEFGATVGSGASATAQTLYAFCVDLTHQIYVGFDTQAGHDIVSANGDAQSSFNYAYHTVPLAVDSVGGASGASGTTLTTTQIGEIGGLANYGAGLIAAADPKAAGFDSQHLSDELAAVQGAIWTVEYPTSSFTASGDVQTLIGQYVGEAKSWATTGPVTAIYADNGSSQGFVVGVAAHGAPGGGLSGAVPEPASWALMIVGFGIAGAGLRRRGSALARAAI